MLEISILWEREMWKRIKESLGFARHDSSVSSHMRRKEVASDNSKYASVTKKADVDFAQYLKKIEKKKKEKKCHFELRLEKTNQEVTTHDFNASAWEGEAGSL